MFRSGELMNLVFNGVRVGDMKVRKSVSSTLFSCPHHYAKAKTSQRKHCHLNCIPFNMQGFSPTPSPPPNLTLPRPNRIKRGRVLSPDLDVDLDCYFRSKRFMTESVTKEMEDVAISDPPLTTSPSRTSTLTRYANSLFFLLYALPHIVFLLYLKSSC